MNFTVDGVSLGAARWEYVENIDKSVCIYIAAPGRYLLKPNHLFTLHI